MTPPPGWSLFRPLQTEYAVSADCADRQLACCAGAGGSAGVPDPFRRRHPPAAARAEKNGDRGGNEDIRGKKGISRRGNGNAAQTC